jgi:hypothetical protein
MFILADLLCDFPEVLSPVERAIRLCEHNQLVAQRLLHKAI